MPEHDDVPSVGFRLTVDITDVAVAVLTELDPFGHGLDDTAISWIDRWCRGNHATESIDRISWPVTETLILTVSAQAYVHLLQLSADLQRTPDNIASTIVNQRAANLVKRKHQGLQA